MGEMRKQCVLTWAKMQNGNMTDQEADRVKLAEYDIKYLGESYVAHKVIGARVVILFF